MARHTTSFLGGEVRGGGALPFTAPGGEIRGYSSNRLTQMLHLSSTILSHALSMTLANKPALRSITLEIVSLQLKLRMPPDVIFAFIRTGYVVTDGTAATFSQSELEDWHRVRTEYFALTAEARIAVSVEPPPTI